MPATLNNEELIDLLDNRLRKVREWCNRLDETPDDATILMIAKRFKKMRDAVELVETRLNAAHASQNTTVNDL